MISKAYRFGYNLTVLLLVDNEDCKYNRDHDRVRSYSCSQIVFALMFLLIFILIFILNICYSTHVM